MTIRSMSRLVLSHLHEIRQRLWNQDETLVTVRLWPETKPMISSTYIAMFLEESKIQQALQDCLQACAASRVVKALYLGHLPEPDLEAALLTLARGLDAKNNSAPAALALRALYIGPLNASSSLSGKVLIKLLQTLAGSSLHTLDCPCRIRLPNQAAVEALARTLGQLPALVRLRLHVIPRTSIERPTLYLDALLRAASDLECLEITAGYPEHNPYQKPIVKTRTLAQIIPRNPALSVLTLANLGLAATHVQALFSGPWPALLQHLSLAYNARLASSSSSSSSLQEQQWGNDLAAKMQDPQRTTLHTVQVPKPCLAVDLWSTLNRLGRARLVQATQGSQDYLEAWQGLMEAAQDEPNELLRMNMDFALIRQHPALSVQTLSSK